MESITLPLLEHRFQWWVFLLATAINIILGLAGIIGLTIGICIDIFVKEVILLTKGHSTPDSVREAIQSAIAEDREDLGAKKPIGRVVGVIERQLYLYGLISGTGGLIETVIIFKAFSGWLTLGESGEKEVSTDAKAERKFSGLRTLARYYSYTIGNFLSVGWALFIFEGLRLALHLSPKLQAILLIAE